MGIVLSNFLGEMPGTNNYDLPITAATLAQDCEFGGTLKPARFYAGVTGKTCTTYPCKVYGTWFNAATPNGILPSPTADDAIDRLYTLNASRLQRSLLSAPTVWENVGVSAPTATLKVDLSQPKTVVASGTTQLPTGTAWTLEFCLMFYGIGSDGKQYFSNPDDCRGTVTGYDNSMLSLTLPQTWVTDAFDKLRVRCRYTPGHPKFVGTTNWATTDGPQIGLFYRRNGTWEAVDDSAVWGTSLTLINKDFKAPNIPVTVYNSTNTFTLTSFDQNDGTTTTNDLASKLLKFSDVTAIQQSAVGAGTAQVDDIPTGEVGMYRAYIFTEAKIVANDALGNPVIEEGVPSDPVTVGPIYSNTIVKLTFSVSPATKSLYTLYRANAGSYLYVSDTLAGVKSMLGDFYVDSVPDDALGEACPSMDWLPPPLLDGVVSTGYGFFIGWSKNRLYCSELYLPHAWPAAYSYTIKYTILRCVSVHNGILAITDNGNYFISGSTPSGLNLVELPTLYPCIGTKAAVDMGSGVMYPSPTGLALVNTSGSQLLTKDSVDPTWWAQQNWGSAVAYRAGEKYVITVGGITYVFNPTDGTLAKSTGMPPIATFDQATGALQTCTGSVGASSFSPAYVWQSKFFDFNHPQSFGWTQCLATNYPVTVDWTVVRPDDVATVVSIIYSSHHPKRFPAGGFHRVQAKITSAYPVSKIVLTNNRQELEYVG